MRKIYFSLLVLILPFLVYGNDGKIEFKTVVLEIASKYPAEDFVVMRTQAQWQKVWDITQGRDISDGGFPVRAPKVDFSKYMLIGVFGGRQPSYEHSVQIESVRLKDDKVIVDIAKDGPSGFVARPVLNSPFHVVEISKAYTGSKFIIHGHRSVTMPQEITLGE